jgi:DnaJ-class molecular chaperone
VSTDTCARPGCLCGGAGHDGGRECPTCHGSGRVWKRPDERSEFYRALCDKCSGVGVVDFTKRKPKSDATIEPIAERSLMQLMDGES